MTQPRLVLVEDDPTVRSFVCMALEDLPITIAECDGVPAAIETLARQAADLIVTDLMMPGESGIDLIDHLHRQPALRGEAKIIMMSAGLTPAVRAELASRDVWCLLDKPVSVKQLEGAVITALGPLLAAAPVPVPAPPPAAMPGPVAAHVQAYFDGDIELYESYRSAVLQQLPSDIESGDTACAGGNLKNLRIVAHSLKSVLATMGYADLAELAKVVENASHAGHQDAAASGWQDLRARMLAFVQAG